jgi:hypothetical protein
MTILRASGLDGTWTGYYRCPYSRKCRHDAHSTVALAGIGALGCRLSKASLQLNSVVQNVNQAGSHYGLRLVPASGAAQHIIYFPPTLTWSHVDNHWYLRVDLHTECRWNTVADNSGFKNIAIRKVFWRRPNWGE